MRKLLNTLYIVTPESYLTPDGENIVVLLENKEKFRLPFTSIENIICFNYMGTSPALMGKCAEKGIGLFFMKPSGRFLARLQGPTHGNVLLRKTQYRLADDQDFCLRFARNLVSAKLANSNNVLRRAISDDNLMQ
jgi:CRISPR-associated protein Cas1